MHPIAQPLAICTAAVSGASKYTPRLIRLPDVEKLTGLKKSTIYAAMSAGTFPGSVRLSVRAVAWREPQVLAWCEARANIRSEA